MPEDMAFEGWLKAAGTARGRPWTFSDRLMSSRSMSSRVERVRSSMSAVVRPLVGIGSRTSPS